MQTCGGTAPRILKLRTRCRPVVSSMLRPIYPRGKKAGTHWVGGRVCPRVCWHVVVNIESLPCRESNSGRPVCSLRTKLFVRFQVLTASSMEKTVFWDMTPCSLVEVDRLFSGAQCLHHNLWLCWQYVRLKRLSASTRLHGVISQKTVFFMLDAVRTLKNHIAKRFYKVLRKVKETRIN
jgi:hypothetical protein